VAILGGDLKANCNNKVAENMSDLINISAKPRTALIKGEGMKMLVGRDYRESGYCIES
jgi:hypothetical protein